MVVKSTIKKRLIDSGIPESVAHRLADDRKWVEVEDLTWGKIMDVGYPNTYARYDSEENQARKTLENVAKAQIIYHLIDIENRPNPADNMPDTPPTLGIFNWWWYEDYEEPNRTLKEWHRFHIFNTQELKGMLKYLKRNSTGLKSVLVARLMKEDLE